jgi:hypothetical protein
MNKQHTPGPWHFGTSSDSSFYKRNIAGADGYHVALTSSRDVSEVDANAQLIAAAPELLAALEEVLAYCSEHGHDWMCMAEARSVILKATGEQK